MLQVNTLRQRLAALEQELKLADKEAFLSSTAAEKAAELAALPLHEPIEEVLEPIKESVKTNGRAKAKGSKLQRQPSKPKMDELADAEKKPKLFEPAVGPPPHVGEEELQAEGTGHEVLLQVCCFADMYVSMGTITFQIHVSVSAVDALTATCSCYLA